MKIKFIILIIVFGLIYSKSRSQIALLNDIKCFNGTTGALVATPIGWGTAPFSYQWSTGATTQSIINLSSGPYSVTITDFLSNDSVFVYFLGQPSQINTVINIISHVSCFGADDGSATISVSGGTPPYTYAWSNGNHNPTANGLAAGIYQVTVTDFNNCTATNSVVINQPPPMTSIIISSTNASCYGALNASAAVSASGGTIPYGYLWSNGSSSPVLSGVSAGTYTVTVTDINGCKSYNTIQLTQPPQINLPVTQIEHVLCNGGNNGLITIIANGGVSPYNYNWSNGSNSTTISDLTSGNYSLVVTDNIGCVAGTSVTINQPTAISIVPVQIIPSDCDGHNNGSAQIAVSGGVPPYTYLWKETTTDSTYTTQNISLVRGGVYNIKVTDFNNCTNSINIVIPNLAIVPITVNVQNYICNGALGSVSIRADSADSAQYYTYIWNSTYNTGSFLTNDSVFQVSTSFLAGNYTITVSENATGCAAYYNFTINQSATPMVVTSTVIHNRCYSDHLGSIRLYVNGGDPLPRYQVVWSGPYGFTSSNFYIAGLVSGDYNYTVTDDGACSQSGTIRILPQMPLQGYLTQTDVSCFGGNNGSAEAFYSGGSGTINYLWSNGANTQQIQNLTDGTYTLIVRDSLNCTVLDTVIITEPPQLQTTVINTQDVSCFGLSDGSISTSTSGGSGTLTYSWLLNGSLFSEVTPSLTNIPAGVYQLTVTDSLFCQVTTTININQPTETIFTQMVQTVSCNNGSDGSWAITPTGSYNPYIAIFSTGDTISTDTVPSPMVSGLSAGVYYCEITASNGCIWNFTQDYQQPLPITVGLADIIPVLCYGDSTGSITLDEVHGGTQPYTYQWSNATTSNPITNIPAGTYHVTITDAKNCTIHETYIVDQPFEPIKFFPTVYATTCQQSEDGKIIVYSEDIYWSPFENYFHLYDSLGNLIDSAGPGEIMGDLPPGLYQILLDNDNGCSAQTFVRVEKGAENCLVIPNMVTPNSDGYNDWFKVKGACWYDSFVVNIFTDLGKKVFESEDCSFIWDPKEKLNASPNTVFYYYIKVTEKGKIFEFRNSINVNY